MNKDSKYVKGVQERSRKRFVLGAFARVKRYLRNRYAVNIARKNGATIGEYVSMPLALAKKANSNLKVGNHTSIQTTKIDLRGKVCVGSYVIIGSNVEIVTGSHNIDSVDWESYWTSVEISDYVWLAPNSIVLPSCCKVGYGAVVAANSIVTKDINKMEIIGGNPGRFIRMRKVVHENLCVEGLLGNDLRTYLNVRKNILD